MEDLLRGECKEQKPKEGYTFNILIIPDFNPSFIAAFKSPSLG